MVACMYSLCSVCCFDLDLVTQRFTSVGLPSPSPRKDYFPHMTLMKLSRLWRSGMRRTVKVKSIDPALYAEWVNSEFGSTAVRDIQLLEMARKEADGFYKCLSKTVFIEESANSEVTATEAVDSIGQDGSAGSGIGRNTVGGEAGLVSSSTDTNAGLVVSPTAGSSTLSNTEIVGDDVQSMLSASEAQATLVDTVDKSAITLVDSEDAMKVTDLPSDSKDREVCETTESVENVGGDEISDDKASEKALDDNRAMTRGNNDSLTVTQSSVNGSLFTATATIVTTAADAGDNSCTLDVPSLSQSHLSTPVDCIKDANENHQKSNSQQTSLDCLSEQAHKDATDKSEKDREKPTAVNISEATESLTAGMQQSLSDDKDDLKKSNSESQEKLALDTTISQGLGDSSKAINQTKSSVESITSGACFQVTCCSHVCAMRLSSMCNTCGTCDTRST